MPTPKGQDLKDAIANMKAVENDREHFYKQVEPGPIIIPYTPFNPVLKATMVKSEEQQEYEQNEMWRND